MPNLNSQASVPAGPGVSMIVGSGESPPICRQFERGEQNGILLGDSGYPCKRFLMTLYLNPQTNAHQRFNAFLCGTRVLIEQSFGILKRMFSCLQGILRTTPEQAVGYVVACVILHNLGIQTGDVMDRVDQPMDAFDQTACPPS